MRTAGACGLGALAHRTAGQDRSLGDVRSSRTRTLILHTVAWVAREKGCRGLAGPEHVPPHFYLNLGACP